MTPLNSIQRGAPGSSRCFSCNLGCNDEVLPAILITEPKIGFTWSKIADQGFRRGYCHGKNRIPLGHQQNSETSDERHRLVVRWLGTKRCQFPNYSVPPVVRDLWDFI